MSSDLDLRLMNFNSKTNIVNHIVLEKNILCSFHLLLEALNRLHIDGVSLLMN